MKLIIEKTTKGLNAKLRHLERDKWNLEQQCEKLQQDLKICENKLSSTCTSAKSTLKRMLIFSIFSVFVFSFVCFSVCFSFNYYKYMLVR